MPDNKNKQKGFVALISVIFVSAILIIVTFTLSSSSFNERHILFSSEMKERSLANAEACADDGLLIIANNSLHTSTTTVSFNSIDNCTLGPIPTSGNPRIFYATSNTSNFVTNLKISVNPTTLFVNSWEEIATY